jgi:hypothetical protein
MSENGMYPLLAKIYNTVLQPTPDELEELLQAWSAWMNNFTDSRHMYMATSPQIYDLLMLSVCFVVFNCKYTSCLAVHGLTVRGAITLTLMWCSLILACVLQ